MIFLDSNIFLRYLVLASPNDPNGRAHQAIATSIFTQLDRGAEEATTTDVVLHEVCYVLASRRHYGLVAADIAAYLEPLLRLPNLKLGRGEKHLYLRAIEIFVVHPTLEFADAIIAARCERLGIPLATFDRRLARLPFLTQWQPPAGASGP